MDMVDENSEKIGAHWAAKRANQNHLKVRWWEFSSILAHYNRLVCGLNLDGVSSGIVHDVRAKFGDCLPLKRGISVGGSNGWKERILVDNGVCEHFTITELSRPLIEEGRRVALQTGQSERFDFHYGDAFELFPDENQFDLVYWDNALHHMMDVTQAVQWSSRVLKPGGLFVMNDFVGATRMQFSDEMLAVATSFRLSLPAYMLRNPLAPDTMLSTVVERCDPAALADEDPSECADSGRILDAVRDTFPSADIVLTGGAIYHAALSDVLGNLNEDNEEHIAILKLALLLDEQMAKAGQTHYAYAIARQM